MMEYNLKPIISKCYQKQKTYFLSHWYICGVVPTLQSKAGVLNSANAMLGMRHGCRLAVLIMAAAHHGIYGCCPQHAKHHKTLLNIVKHHETHVNHCDTS